MTRDEAVERAVEMRGRGMTWGGIATAFALLTSHAYSDHWWRRELRGRVAPKPHRNSHSLKAKQRERAERTRCRNGHPYDAENTYVRTDGARVCRTCQRDARRKYEAAT